MNTSKIAERVVIQAMNGGNQVEDFQKTLDVLERDIKRARLELKEGNVGLYSAHLAHQLKNGAYADRWYELLFK